MGRITRVAYRYQIIHGRDFENETVEAEALVEPDELPEVILKQLKSWVLDRLGCELDSTVDYPIPNKEKLCRELIGLQKHIEEIIDKVGR